MTFNDKIAKNVTEMIFLCYNREKVIGVKFYEK